MSEFSPAAAAGVVLLGALSATLVVRLREPIARRLDVVDLPASQAHKAHTLPTPLVGGLAVLPTAVGVCLACAALGAPGGGGLAALGLLVGLSTAIGVADDRLHLRAVVRLAWCGVAFLVGLALHPEFLVSRINFQSIGFQFEFGRLALPFTILCLLAFQNAVNMADGRNGLVVGLSIIWIVCLLSFGWHATSPMLLAALSGLVVVMVANMRGRLFLGDGGTYGLGAMLGVSTVWLHRTVPDVHTVDVLAMFLVPILDLARLSVLRLARGVHPFTADRDHLHHHLDAALGWTIGRRLYFLLVAAPILVTRTNILPPLSGVALAVLGYAAVVAYCVTRVRRRGDLAAGGN